MENKLPTPQKPVGVNISFATILYCKKLEFLLQRNSGKSFESFRDNNYIRTLQYLVEVDVAYELIIFRGIGKWLVLKTLFPKSVDRTKTSLSKQCSILDGC